jgi:hypothetical protein
MNGWHLTKFMSFYVDQTFRIGYCLVYGLLTPLSKIFQLFCVGLSYIWKKLEKNTNLLQVCDKFYHMLYHITHISPHAGIEVVMGTDGMLTMQYVCQPRLPRWSPS